MSRFMKDKFQSMDSYVPGEQPRDMDYIKLNTNESPYPPSDKVIEAVSSGEVSKLRLYPDPECKYLKKALADNFGVKSENIFVSNGSDDILNFAFMAFSENGISFPDISYGFYEVFAKLHGASYEKIPLKGDFTIDYKDYLAKNTMIAIANPNAPTGIALKKSEIEEIVKSNPESIVLIDEAYVDFGGESCVGLTKKYDNLLVVQTFSKSRSLAGGRVGFAIADEAVIADLEKIKYSTNPYSINSLSLIAATEAVLSKEYYLEKCAEIADTREKTSLALKNLGFEVLDSKANFIFAKKQGISGQYIYEKLREMGILVRHFSAERIKDYNRITIGTPEQMSALVDAMKNILYADARRRNGD